MEILKADLVDLHAGGEVVVITTNGTVTQKGRAVMGRGCAKQFAELFPELPDILGTKLKKFGLKTQFLTDRIISFPVKHEWWQLADIELIRKSLDELDAMVKTPAYKLQKVYMPMAGCGNGKLLWQMVEPLFNNKDKRIVVVDNGS